MKTTTLTLVALGFAFALHAQNWQPILENERHHFQGSGTDFISNTIYIDSVTTEGQEIFYHLNRIVLECDTCSDQFVPYFLFDEGQFLQQRMVLQADNGYRLEGEKTLFLYPEASVGSSWTFDIANNVDATVTDKLEQTVFDQPDSVKVITLSSGGEIVLSKNHGLLSFLETSDAESYALAGLEMADLGEQLPTHWDFFDFDVGDVFQYYSRNSTEVGTPFYAERTEKQTILEKEELSDGYRYRTRIVGKEGEYNGWYFESTFEDTIWMEYRFSDTVWFNRYPMEAGYVKEEPNLICYDDPQMGKARGKVSYYVEDGRRGKVLGGIHELHPLFCPSYDDPTLGDRFITDEYWEVYEEGIGLVDYALWIFEVTASKTLQGYVKGGDTTGVVTDDVILDTDAPFIASNRLTIAPNPARDQLWLELEAPLAVDARVEIWTLTGQRVQSAFFEKGQLSAPISVVDIPKGAYILLVITKEGVVAERFLKG
jgi:hypothetical protein